MTLPRWCPTGTGASWKSRGYRAFRCLSLAPKTRCYWSSTSVATYFGCIPHHRELPRAMSNVGSRRSRHVLLYGPPAAGKLTVAKLLTADYGMHLLDNHVSLDPARRLFDFGDSRLAPVVETIRITLLSAAARAGLDVVSTLVFAHPIDRDHVTRLKEASEFCGAEVSFVQLVANPEVLARRVGMPSRGTNKITDAAQLHRMLDR